MRLLRYVLAALLPLCAAVPVPARAEVADPWENGCGWTRDGTLNYFDGGPISVVDEDDPSVVRTATITCSVTALGRHSDPPVASVTSEPQEGVVHLPPSVVVVPEDFEPNAVCTRLDVSDGNTWYLTQDHRVYQRWTRDPDAWCHALNHPSDDHLGDDVRGAAAAFGGEAYDLAVAAADPALCAAEPLATEWGCGTASTYTGFKHVSIVRAADAGALLRTVPWGFTCTDVHTGLVVGPGSPLATPDPGVSCAAPYQGYACSYLDAYGVLAPTVLGRVAVTASCGSASVLQRLTPTQGSVLVLPVTHDGGGAPPFRCTVDEDVVTVAADPAYSVWCAVEIR